MDQLRNMLDRLPLWRLGEFLVGLTIMISGAYVAWLGISRLRELWGLYASLLPLAVTEDTGQRLLDSLPLVVTRFINTVASLAAVLMGVTWALSGIAEAFEARKKPSDPAAFEQPELVAESLRTAQGQYWRTSSWFGRLTGHLLPRTRMVSPVSYQILSDLGRSCWRILFVGLLIWGALEVLAILPAVLKRYVQVDIRVAIPSGKPLFILLGLLLVVYLLIAVSLIPLRRPQFLRTTEYVPVRGRGDPQAFFALVEEGCRLLTAAGTPRRGPIRLEDRENPEFYASLVETPAEPLKSVARPVAYGCLPLALIVLTNGFARLVYFQKPITTMPWGQFLAQHLPAFLLEVGFALGLIVVAMHLVERARRLFGVRRYRSGLILLHVHGEQTADAGPQEEYRSGRASPEADEVSWQPADAADDRFADWVRDRHKSRRFTVEAQWAQAFTESANADGQRFLIGLRQSKPLDEAMQHILQIPFHVAFEPDGSPPVSDRPPEAGGSAREVA